MRARYLRTLAWSAAAMAGIAVVPGAWAADGSWTPWGPGEGTLQALTLDPAAGPAGLCIAPHLGGVLCSGDGGTTWEPRTAGLDGANVVALAADPAVPGGLLAAAAGGSVFRRGEKVWELVYDGRAWGTLAMTFDDPPFAVKLVVDPVPGRPSRLFLTAGAGVYRSEDGGGTWRLVLATTAPVADLAVDPASPGTVFVASRPRPFPGHSGPGGLLKSIDAGASWKAVGPPGGWPRGVGLVAVAGWSPAVPATVYAGPNSAGLFRSRDGGLSWEALSTATTPGTQNGIAALAIDPVSPATVVAARSDGIFLSQDGGDTWLPFGGTAQQEPFVPSYVTRLALGPGARRLWASTMIYGGLFATADRGRRWAEVYAAAQDSSVVGGRLRFDPADPSTVYALVGGFAFRSRDGGMTWQSLDDPLLLGTTDLAFAPATRGAPAGMIYAATGAGLLASADRGATWRRSLAVSAASAVAVLGPHTLLAGGCGAALSHDGGRTATPTLSCDDPGDGSHPADFSRRVRAFEVDPFDSRKVYARVYELTGASAPTLVQRVFRSADGGVTWAAVLDGGDVVATDPSRPGIVYLLAGTELRRSGNHGRSFTPISTRGLEDFTALGLAVDPAAPAVLYAAGQGGVRRSADGGSTWAPDDRGLGSPLPFDPPGTLLASDLFFAPGTAGALYVAANGTFYTRTPQ
jgi:photosystem II stability/assembly factor-like uncharacterized protein